MKIITTILCLLAIACQADTNEIEITGAWVNIQQPGKTRISFTAPLILTPADRFDVKLLPDRVVVTPRSAYITIQPLNEYTPSTELKTNWFSIENGAREIGLIIEETVATIVRNSKTNRFVLESREVGTTGPRKAEIRTLFLTNSIVTPHFVWPNDTGGR